MGILNLIFGRKRLNVPAMQSSVQESVGSRETETEQMAVVITEHAPIGVEPAPWTPDFAPPSRGLRSYLTRSLRRLGYREIMLVVAHPEGGIPEHWNAQITRYLEWINSCAREGKGVDYGDCTRFADFLGLANCGMAYLEGTRGPGPAVPEDTLLALLLQASELPAVHTVGVYRPASWLGWRYRIYPYPVFSDPLRASAVPAGLKESILTKTPKLQTMRSSSVTLLNRRRLVLTLVTNDDLCSLFRQAFHERREEPFFAVTTGHDARADGRLVFLPKETAESCNAVIAVTGSQGNAVEGRFVVLVGNQETCNARILEDGFAITLTAAAWGGVRDAIENRSSITVALDGQAGNIQELTVETKPSN